MDVNTDPEGKQRLLQMGITSLPVVVFGDQFAYGLDLEKMSRLIGKALQLKVLLSPDELVGRINISIKAAIRYTNQFPEDSLEKKVISSRSRTWQELVYHVFFILEIFMLSYNGGIYSMDLNYAQPPETIKTKGQLIKYGEGALLKFNKWWQDNQNTSFKQERQAYYGQVTLHEVLERTAWHSTQHVRQMMDFLERNKIQPDIPLSENDFEGLPLPKAVWD